MNKQTAHNETPISTMKDVHPKLYNKNIFKENTLLLLLFIKLVWESHMKKQVL